MILSEYLYWAFAFYLTIKIRILAFNLEFSNYSLLGSRCRLTWKKRAVAAAAMAAPMRRRARLTLMPSGHSSSWM